MIVGYSLAHNQLFAPVFAQSLGLIPSLVAAGHADKAEQVIIGQKCLEAEYQKGGLMGMMDRILYTHLSKEFTHYLGSIAKANSNSLGFVMRSGYKEVYASDLRMYFMIDIKPSVLNEGSYRAVRSDGTIVRFRFAEESDIAGLAAMNNRWLKDNLNDLSHGYLAAAFSDADWKFMTDRKWVVLAETV